MASQRTPYSKTQRNIYQRGATFQVKLQVNGAWISETFDTERDAEDFRDLKRVAKNRDADFARVVAARAAKRPANPQPRAGPAVPPGAGIPEDPTFLKDLRLYDLRHEAISSLFEETDLRDLEIAAIAGHANLNTTAKYTHLRVHRMAARMQRAKAAAPT